MATQNLGNVRALIVSATAPTNTDLLWRNTSVSPQTINIYNSVTAIWEPVAMSSGGQDNTASNLGTGDGLFSQKVGVDLQFRSLIGGDHITLNSTTTEVTIATDGDSDTLNSQNAAFYRNASNINAGTLSNARLSSNVVRTDTGGITRQEQGALTPTGTYTINFNNRNEYLTTALIIINQNTTIAFSNQANGRLAVIDISVSSATRQLTFPTGTLAQSSETRWTSATRILTLEVGRYKMTIKRNSNTDYTLECSDSYV